MDITVEGKPVKAVAMPSKQGFLYVYDRATGASRYGRCPNSKVPRATLPGEWYSPTQPNSPPSPPPYALGSIRRERPGRLLTPTLHAKALELVKDYRLGPVYTPPVLSQSPRPLGVSSTCRPMAAPTGPARASLKIPRPTSPTSTPRVQFLRQRRPVSLVPGPKQMTDLRYVVGVAGETPMMIKGPGEASGADSPPPPKHPGPSGYRSLDVDGLPLLKPPYSTITAMDLDKGVMLWQIPHGETPDLLRHHPALKGLDIPRTGQVSYGVGVLVTKSLIIAGDPQVTTTADHPRGAMLRAYDKKTGKEVGAVWMPAGQSGSPMTYQVGGKQYLVIAVSGGNYSGEYNANDLPSAE